MAAMQTGARRATSATGAKTGKGKNGEVIVEKVMTSDSFLSREIKKAPLIEHDGSLVADISHIPNDLKITIQGAREHNLKNVDLAIPRNRMVVFTGLSGSGKSSLAFDTLFAEGQRRYVESLSAYARQFLGQMDKPDVDFIEGLSPAVSIDQKTTNRNPRSTVGTITEIYDYLRLLFARTGIPHCPECGARRAPDHRSRWSDTLLGYPERTRFLDSRARGERPQGRVRRSARAAALRRLRPRAHRRRGAQPPTTSNSTKKNKHTIEVVVDRIVVKDGIRQRLTEAVEPATSSPTAASSSTSCPTDARKARPARRQPFSDARLPEPGTRTRRGAAARLLLQRPLRRLPRLHGLGFKLEVDAETSSSPTRTVTERGRHRTVGSTNMTPRYYRHVLEGLAKEMGFSMDPLEGPAEATSSTPSSTATTSRCTSPTAIAGDGATYATGFEGVAAHVLRRHDETDSQNMKAKYYESYMREVPCQACHGARLRPKCSPSRWGTIHLRRVRHARRREPRVDQRPENSKAPAGRSPAKSSRRSARASASWSTSASTT